LGGTPGLLVLKILDEYANDTRAAYSINQLALSTGKAYPNVHATVAGLLKENILTKEVIGHSHHCRLNLENDTTLLYLSLLQTHRKTEWLRQDRSHISLLKAIDDACGTHNILLVWDQGNDLFIVTATPCSLTSLNGKKITSMTLHTFLEQKELQATIGKHTLIFGHALYTTIMGQARLSEVLR